MILKMPETASPWREFTDAGNEFDPQVEWLYTEDANPEYLHELQAVLDNHSSAVVAYHTFNLFGQNVVHLQFRDGEAAKRFAADYGAITVLP